MYDDPETEAVEEAPDPATVNIDEVIADKKLAWLTGELPQGTDVDQYYVWAKAPEGENWTASAGVFAGTAEIGPATATLTLSGIDENYFLNSKGKNGVFTTEDTGLVPSSTVKIGDLDLTETYGDKVVYYVVPKNEGGSLIWGQAKVLTETLNLTAGNYRMYATIPAQDKFEAVNAADGIFADFSIVRGKVTVQTTPVNLVAPLTGAYPTFGFDVKEWEGASEATTEPAFNGVIGLTEENVIYNWYKDAECTIPVLGEWNANTTYYVLAEYDTEAFATVDHEVVVLPATVFVAQGEIIAQIEDQTLVYGQQLPLQLKYLEGALVPGSDEVENFEERFWREGFYATMIKDAEGKDVTDAIAIPLTYNRTNRTNVTTLLPVGTYTVAFDRDDEGAAVQILANEATWTITPKDINNSEEDFTSPRVGGLTGTWSLDKEYTSEQIQPEKSDFGGIELQIHQNYSRPNIYARTIWRKALVWGEDFKVEATGENINAGEGVGEFTITGIGNYTGTKVVNFDITKAPIVVAPKAGQTWEIGTDENFEIDTEAIKTQLKDFKNDKDLDLATANGFKDLAVKRIVGSTVGTYEQGLVAYLPEDAAEADNYKFTFGKADLTITPGKIVLAAKDLEATYNGTDVPDYTPSLVLAEGSSFYGATSEAGKVLEANWQALVKGMDKVVYTLEDAEKYNVGTYTITPTDPENALTATNYTVTLADPAAGTLTVVPAKVTVTAMDQIVDFEVFLDADHNLDQAKVATITANPEKKVNIVTLKAGDKAEDLVAALTISGIKAFEDNTITVTAKENANYEIETKAGKLTVNALPGIALTSVEADQATIASHNEMPVESVSLTLKAPKLETAAGENAAFALWKAGEWHALVLPFAVKVRDISNNFGYAIVNVVDPAKAEENDVHFKLQNITETIPANTPFCVKSDEDFDFRALKFNNVVIEAPAAPQVGVSAADDYDYMFMGTYEPLVIDNTMPQLRFLGANSKWYYIAKEGSKFNMQPYTGYVDLQPENAARSINFHFEEADGTTTTIESVDFMKGNSSLQADGWYNLNGIKMEAPTQKGVYINNGRKVVIK